MNEQSINEILSILLSESSVTADFLAQKTNTSNKTVRTRLAEVRAVLQTFHLTLVSKPGHGYHIEGSPADRLRLSQYLESNREETRTYPPSERVYCILYQLLRFDRTLHLAQLEQTLYASRSSLYLDLQKCRDFLSPYHLTVLNDRKKGLWLSGTENRRRDALYHLIHKLNRIEYPLYNKELRQFLRDSSGDSFASQNIVRLLHQFEKKKNIRLAVEDFEYLRLMFFISVDRIQHGFSMVFDNRYNELLYSLSMVKKMDLSRQVLCENFHTAFSQDEVLYLSSLFLKLKKTNLNFVNDIRLEQQAAQIIRQYTPLVYREYPIRNREEFENGLFHHVLNLLKKQDFLSDQETPLFDQIKKEFAVPYPLAEELIPMIEAVTGLTIPQEEAAYIVLHIASAIEQSLPPLRILFLYEHRYSELNYAASLIEAHIKEIDIVAKMRYQDYAEQEVKPSCSVIFATFPYRDPAIPVYQIPMIPDKTFIRNLREDLRKRFTRQQH